MRVSFTELPENEVKSDILVATYIGITEHGYADFTVNHIANEIPNSKAIIYYYYDGKDEIIYDLLEHLQMEIDKRMESYISKDASDCSLAFLNGIFPSILDGDEKSIHRMIRAYILLRVQIPNSKWGDGFENPDKYIRERLANIIRSNIGNGSGMSSSESHRIAAFLQYAISGRIMHYSIGMDHHQDDILELKKYLSTRLHCKQRQE